MTHLSHSYLLIDVGDTLVRITEPFEKYTLQAIENIYPYFYCDKNLETFKNEVFSIRNSIRDKAHKTLIENDFNDFINEICEQLNCSLPTSNIEVEQAYVKAELNITTLFEDAIPFLKKAKKANKKLIIASNNFSAEHVNLLLQQFNLIQYFDAIIVSASLKIRKPNKLFLKDYVSKNSIIIGDKLNMDIAVANNCSIDSCWINRKKQKNDTLFTPTYQINSLNEIEF